MNGLLWAPPSSRVAVPLRRRRPRDRVIVCPKCGAGAGACGCCELDDDVLGSSLSSSPASPKETVVCGSTGKGGTPSTIPKRLTIDFSYTWQSGAGCIVQTSGSLSIEEGYTACGVGVAKCWRGPGLFQGNCGIVDGQPIDMYISGYLDCLTITNPPTLQWGYWISSGPQLCQTGTDPVFASSITTQINGSVDEEGTIAGCMSGPLSFRCCDCATSDQACDRWGRIYG